MSYSMRGRSAAPSPIVVLYKDSASDDCTVLMTNFNMIGHGERRTAVDVNGRSFSVDVSEPEKIVPEGPLSLTEKLVLRFEKAQALAQNGEPGVRVDLRFCTGHEGKRNPAQDSYRSDYNMGYRP